MLREAGGFEMVEKVIGYCDEECRMNFMGEEALLLSKDVLKLPSNQVCFICMCMFTVYTMHSSKRM